MHKIYINHKPLSQIFAEHLEIDPNLQGNALEKEIIKKIKINDEEDKRAFAKSTIENIIRTELPNAKDHVDTLYKLLHQGALLFPGMQAIRANALPPYLAGTECMRNRVDIYTKNDEILIEEWTELFKIQKDELDKETFLPVSISYEDKRSMLTVKNRLSLIVEDDSLKYRHADMLLEYHDDRMKPIFDERNIFEKIRDAIKALFNLNKIDEFKVEKPVDEVDEEEGDHYTI
ncbi:MAG: hypothetical protein HYX60_07465 [Legionella longbeachae]|nr:hypothetical protein [Legionella longbeachae]